MKVDYKRWKKWGPKGGDTLKKPMEDVNTYCAEPKDMEIPDKIDAANNAAAVFLVAVANARKLKCDKIATDLLDEYEKETKAYIRKVVARLSTIEKEAESAYKDIRHEMRICQAQFFECGTAMRHVKKEFDAQEIDDKEAVNRLFRLFPARLKKVLKAGEAANKLFQANKHKMSKSQWTSCEIWLMGDGAFAQMAGPIRDVVDKAKSGKNPWSDSKLLKKFSVKFAFK